MSSPIRVGLIGLGQVSGLMSPGTWTATSHLPYFLASPKYEIVALANSTVESAQGSIAFHKLGSQVKAYGTPEDLANDPNVDLIVVSVMVGKHYMLAKPALLAGKDIFVEWPLGVNTAEAEELTELAASKGVKTIVGLQARASPLVVKLKDIIASDKIGKVMSSTVVGSFTGLPPDMWIDGAEYYLDIQSGGNTFTISFGHFFDSFVHVLGTFTQPASILHTEYPNVAIIKPSTGEVTNPNYPRTAPDHILVQGALTSGAVASIIFRTVVGAPVDGTTLRWLITGTSGEIEVTLTQPGWQMEVPGTTLRVRYGKEAAAETIDLSQSNEAPAVAETGLPGTNTARLYEAFATGENTKFASFADALATHRALDAIRSASK